MKRLSRWIPELTLGAALLGLAVLLVVPGSSRGVYSSSTPAMRAAPVPQPVTPQAAAPPTSPRQLAFLFGWREAPAVASAPAPARPAEEAAWVVPIGYVVDQAGTPSYVFKDTRARAVFALKVGIPNKGWKLLEAREREFLLEFSGRPYIIKRKP